MEQNNFENQMDEKTRNRQLKDDVRRAYAIPNAYSFSTIKQGSNPEPSKLVCERHEQSDFWGSHLAITKKLSVHKKTRFIQSRLFYSLNTA